MMETPVHVIGAGGIGVAMGYALARAGCQVVMVEKHPGKLAAGQSHGMTVEGHGTIKVPFVAFNDWTPPSEAILLLCTKTFDNPEVLDRIENKQQIIPVQNGFDILLDSQPHYGEAISSFVSECERNRPYTRITRPGDLYIGPRRPASDAEKQVLANLADALKEGGLFTVQLVDDILPYKAAKLMYNAAISPLAASAGVDNATLLSDKLAKRLFFKLILENYAILKHARLPLAKIGPFHPDTVAKILKTPGLPEIMAVFFKPSLRGTYCSMAPDIGSEHTEIDAYNGHLVNLAGDMPCPYNRAAVRLINYITAQRMAPNYAHLDIMVDGLKERGITV